MTFRLISNFDAFDWAIELETLLMIIWYPPLLMLFVVLLGYYAAFELMYFRANTNVKRIGIPKLLFLFLEMLPSLRNITHFGNYETGQYSDCASWKEGHRYCKDYKRGQMRKTRS